MNTPDVNSDDKDRDSDGFYISEGRARRPAVRGMTAQLMVLVNGLVLAATAYVVLNAFIHRMLEDDYKRIMTDTQQAVSQSLSDLEQSVRSVSSIVALSPNVNPGELSRRVAYGAGHLERFDRLYWVKKDASGQWQIEDLIAGKETSAAVSLFTPGSEQSLKDFLVSHMPTDNQISVAANLPGSGYIEEFSDPVIKSRLFVVMQRISPETGMIAGMGRATDVLGKGWIDGRPDIYRMVIRDSQSGERLFYMSRDRASEDIAEFDSSAKNFSFQLGNAEWQLQVDLGKKGRAALLEMSPLLVLLFGTVLTIIGVMYVRNYQRQSVRLTVMNRALAQKNYELNSEVIERERLNQTLRKAEREYRAIIDSVSDIIFETSTEGELLFLNNTWRKITGFDVEQSLNRKLFDMIHPQDQEEQRRKFENMVKGQHHAYRSFTRLRTAEGTFRAVELAISMLRQDEGRNLRVVGTVTDVEERRRAEKALSEAEKKFRTIVENAAGGIYQVTPEGQFLSANPAMARILGYDSQDQILRMVKNAHEDLYASKKERWKFIHDLESSGIMKNFEIQVVRKDGNKIWVNENARIVKDDEGNILYFEGSMEDITKRKEAEIKLREAKIQSDLASRAKSEFLANMSHELRTPLNAIIGFSEIIKDEVLGPLANKQYWEYVRDIHESGRKLLNIINEILDVSRIEAGERQLNEGIVDFTKVAKSCISFIGPKADAGRLSIVNLLDRSTPKVIGEELAIKQMLLNLLSNAVKYTPAGGRVTMIHEMDREGQLRISVTDTGVGLDEFEIEKALSPFGQVETSLNRTGSGAGLGLTLVDSLIRLHGGRLELFSQKGIGTTATVVFPARRVAQESAEDEEAQKEVPGGQNPGISTHDEGVRGKPH